MGGIWGRFEGDLGGILGGFEGGDLGVIWGDFGGVCGGLWGGAFEGLLGAAPKRYVMLKAVVILG